MAKKKKRLLLRQLPWLHLRPLLLRPLPLQRLLLHPLMQPLHLPLRHPPPRLQHLHLSKSQKKRSRNRFLPCATKRPLFSGFFVVWFRKLCRAAE